MSDRPSSASPVVDDAKAECEPFRCAELLLDALPRVMWFVRREMRRNDQIGLSVPQLRAMTVLAAYNGAGCSGAPLSTIAANLGSTMPNTSRIISGLVKKGLVHRADAESDRRCLALHLTELGEQTLASAKRATRLAVADILSRASAPERAELSRAAVIMGALFDLCPEVPAQTDDAAQDEG